MRERLYGMEVDARSRASAARNNGDLAECALWVLLAKVCEQIIEASLC